MSYVFLCMWYALIEYTPKHIGCQNCCPQYNLMKEKQGLGCALVFFEQSEVENGSALGVRPFGEAVRSTPGVRPFDGVTPSTPGVRPFEGF